MSGNGLPLSNSAVGALADVDINAVKEDKKKDAIPEKKNEPEAAAMPPCTPEELRGAFGALANSKGKDAAKGILSAMGFAKVTEIPADRYNEAMERIREVG